MFVIDFVFHESASDDHLGFKLGDMRVIGDHGTAGTEGTRNPNQSMMLVLSIVHLLDGLGPFLQNRRRTAYQFDAIDSSFSISFRRERDRRITVRARGQLIHSAEPQLIKSSIVSSVLRFVDTYDLPSMMNEAEAGDFQNAFSHFQTVMPAE